MRSSAGRQVGFPCRPDENLESFRSPTPKHSQPRMRRTSINGTHLYIGETTDRPQAAPARNPLDFCHMGSSDREVGGSIRSVRSSPPFVLLPSASHASLIFRQPFGCNEPRSVRWDRATLGAGDTGHGHVTSGAMYVVRHLGGLAVDPPRALLNGLRL